MDESVQNAFVGAVMGELLGAVLDAQRKAAAFRPTLQRIETTLRAIIPLVEEIEELNEKLDRKKEETAPLIEEISRGKDLVVKCSKIRWYTCWKKPGYKDKLDSLEGSLQKFCKFVLQLQRARDTKEALVEMKNVQLILDGKSSGIITGLKGYFVPQAIPNPVGFQVPLEELKMELFKDETSLLVLSGPPGCGKTTLATLFCHDKDVQERFGNNIFFIPVSGRQTMDGIVQRLFQLKGQRDRMFRGEADARHHLERLLKSMEPSPILLILDDVRPETAFLLEKLKFNIPGYKILVTSRSEYRKYKNYKLNPLNDEHSRTLFNNSAFLPDQPAPDVPDGIVNQIVKECKGNPQEITAAARALCGEPAEVWRARAMELHGAGAGHGRYGRQNSAV